MMCLGVLGKRSYHGAVSWVKRQILRLQTAKAVSKRHGPLWAFLYLCSGPEVLLVFAVGVFWPAVREARWWVYAFYSTVGLWVVQVFYLQPEERVEEGEPSRRSIRVRLHLGGPGLFFAVLAAILTVVILLIPIRALRQARVALQGEPVVNTFPFPAWGAQPAIVSRGKEAAGDLPVAAGGHCLMYLGQAAGTAVLYDVDSGQTVRIPSGSVTITTARSRSEDVSACRTTLVRDEVLGVSAGTAAQRFRVARPPVVPGSLDVEVEEEAGSARWYAVRNFEESRPSDRHYMLHTETGEVLFGDGQRGRFPASGAKIIARRYRQGRLSS